MAIPIAKVGNGVDGSAFSASAVTSLSITNLTTQTAGNFVYLQIGMSAAAAVTSISGTYGATWQIQNINDANGNGCIAYSTVPASPGSTLTINFSTAVGASATVSSFAYSANYLDIGLSYVSNPLGTYTSPSATTTNTGDLQIVSFFAAQGSEAFVTSGNSFANLASQSNGLAAAAPATAGAAYQIMGVASTGTAQATMTPSVATANIMTILSVPEAAAWNLTNNKALSASSSSKVSSASITPTVFQNDLKDGSFVIVFLSMNSATLSSITGTYTGSWHIYNGTASGHNLAVAWVFNAPSLSGSQTVILNFSAATTYSCLGAIFTGVGSATDNSIVFQADASSSNETSATITTNFDNDLVIDVCSINASGLGYGLSPNLLSINYQSNGGSGTTAAEVIATYGAPGPAGTAFSGAINVTNNPAQETGIASFRLGSYPDAPTSFAASSVSSTKINTSWVAPSQYVASYTIDRSTDPYFATNLTSFSAISSSSTSYSDTTVVANTTYYYRIKAINAIGISYYSATSSAKAGTTSVNILFRQIGKFQVPV